MSLLFNMLSWFVIAFLQKSKHLLISWLQSQSAVILEAKKIKSHCFHCFPIYLQWSDGTTCHDLSFLSCWALSQLFHYPLSLSSRGSSVPLHFLPWGWCHLHMRLLIFLLEISIPACVSSSPAFFMMYSPYKLNNQGDNIQPWHTPFPIWNPSVVPCPVLTVIQ